MSNATVESTSTSNGNRANSNFEIGYDTFSVSNSPTQDVEPRLTTPPPLPVATVCPISSLTNNHYGSYAGFSGLLPSTGHIIESSKASVISKMRAFRANMSKLKNNQVTSMLPLHRRRQRRIIPNSIMAPLLDKLIRQQMPKDQFDLSSHPPKRKKYQRRRPLSPINQQDLEVSAPVFIRDYDPRSHWCETCRTIQRVDECPLHPRVLIPDCELPSRARLTLPKCLKLAAIKETCPSSDIQERELSSDYEDRPMGVFTKVILANRARFGPVEAPFGPPSSFLLRVDQFPRDTATPFNRNSEFTYLQLTDESVCNWLMLVRPATNTDHQNLIAYQSGEHIYYETTQSIAIGKELRVWYAVHYALRLGLKTLSPLELVAQDEPAADKRRTTTRKKLFRTKAVHLRRAPTSPEDDVYPSDELYCSLCQLTFHSDELLQLHKLVHPEAVKARFLDEYDLTRECSCVACSIVTKGMVNLGRHVAEHAVLSPKFFPSPIAEVSVDLDVSQRNLDTEPECCIINCYACGICGHKAFDSKELKDHKSSCHPTSVTKTQSKMGPYGRCEKLDQYNMNVCRICGAVLANLCGLITHSKIHQDADFFQCSICQQKFHTSKALNHHVESHRVQQSQEKGGASCFRCHKCVRDYLTYDKLSNHIRYVHSKQVFLCPQCPKKFGRRSKLRDHISSHSSIRNYVCNQCGNCFKRKDTLVFHQKKSCKAIKQKKMKLAAELSNHPESVATTTDLEDDLSLYVFKCQACLTGFKRRGMFVNHMNRMHPDIPLDSIAELNMPVLTPVRNYYCQYCSKIFRQSSHRKEHIRRRHPTKQLPTDRRKGLNYGYPIGVDGTDWCEETHTQHVVNVVGKVHSCEDCGKQYTILGKLTAHRRLKHPDKVPASSAKVKQSEMPPLTNSSGDQNLIQQKTESLSNFITIRLDDILFESSDNSDMKILTPQPLPAPEQAHTLVVASGDVEAGSLSMSLHNNRLNSSDKHDGLTDVSLDPYNWSQDQLKQSPKVLTRAALPDNNSLQDRSNMPALSLPSTSSTEYQLVIDRSSVDADTWNALMGSQNGEGWTFQL